MNERSCEFASSSNGGIDGRRFVALTEHLGAIPQTVLGKIVGSGETQRYEIIAALDLLFTGI